SGSEEKKEEKKEEKASEKIVAALTFNNGIMVSSLKELRDVLPNFDEDVLAEHVNDEKNDIAKWAREQFGDELGEKLAKAKTKDELIKSIDEFVKSKEGGEKESGKEKGGKK
ncbi:hypothetical protein D6817_01650, partial [Candidatus Pacearchaeota archaeon]